MNMLVERAIGATVISAFFAFVISMIAVAMDPLLLNGIDWGQNGYVVPLNYRVFCQVATFVFGVVMTSIWYRLFFQGRASTSQVAQPANNIESHSNIKTSKVISGGTSETPDKTTREIPGLPVGMAYYTAVTSYTSMADMFPDIRSFKHIDDWNFFVTAAIVGSSMFHLQMALDTDQVESIQLEIAAQLTSIHPQAWDAISDLAKFIDRTAGAPLGASIGSWVVWNLKGSAPVESDWPFASAIGRFCYERIGKEIATEFI